VSDLVDARLLIVTNVVVAAVCVALVVATIITKVRRHRAERQTELRHHLVRPLVVAVAAGEDDDGTAEAALTALPPPARADAEAVILGMLSKIRGEPATSLVRILGDFGSIRRALDDLDSRSVVRRSRATWLLGMTRDPAVAPAIRPRLGDHEAEVRLLAVEALGRIGDADSATAVLDTLTDGRGQPGVPAASVAEALMAMGPGIAEPLRRALDDPRESVREVAATVAGHGLFGQLTPRLLDRVDDDLSRTVRASAARAVGAIGGHAAVEVLARATAAGNPPAVRHAAAAALGELGQREGVATLCALLDDDDRRLAEIAALSLLDLGQPGRNVLVSAAAGDDGPGNAAAAFILDVHRLQTAGRQR
jgi:HEAT repeat protein